MIGRCWELAVFVAWRVEHCRVQSGAWSPAGAWVSEGSLNRSQRDGSGCGVPAGRLRNSGWPRRLTVVAIVASWSAAPAGCRDVGSIDAGASSTAPAASTAPAPRLSTPAQQRPVLGVDWGHGQRGFGEVAPATVFTRGDRTGLVKDIDWDSWSGRQAVGHGEGVYPGNVAQGSPVDVTVIAFRLGTCRGVPAYQAVEWFAPSRGQRFDPRSYINACTGDDVLPGATPSSSPGVTSFIPSLVRHVEKGRMQFFTSPTGNIQCLAGSEGSAAMCGYRLQAAATTGLPNCPAGCSTSSTGWGSVPWDRSVDQVQEERRGYADGQRQHSYSESES